MDKAPIQYRELSSPVSVQAELTPRCNNLCNYCYNAWRGEKEFEKELSLEDYSSIAKKLIQNDIFEVILTGGEPLLRKDLVYPLASYLRRNNIEVGLNTNMVLLKQGDIPKIIDSGINKVLGSLPSYDEKAYNKITQTKNYKRALNGLELLAGGGVPTAINMVVEQENKNQVYDTGKFVYERGIHIFSGTPALPSPFLSSNQELSSADIIHTLDELLKLENDFGMRADILEPIPMCFFCKPRKV